MAPASGSRIPAIQRSVVVLPAPFGPTRPRISPARTSNETVDGDAIVESLGELLDDEHGRRR
jgi:hypothetical protein